MVNISMKKNIQLLQIPENTLNSFPSLRALNSLKTCKNTNVLKNIVNKVYLY